MLELIIALFLSLGIVSSPDQVNQETIQQNQHVINKHIIDDDLIAN